jgi:hypothetical protein
MPHNLLRVPAQGGIATDLTGLQPNLRVAAQGDDFFLNRLIYRGVFVTQQVDQGRALLLGERNAVLIREIVQCALHEIVPLLNRTFAKPTIQAASETRPGETPGTVGSNCKLTTTKRETARTTTLDAGRKCLRKTIIPPCKNGYRSDRKLLGRFSISEIQLRSLNRTAIHAAAR